MHASKRRGICHQHSSFTRKPFRKSIPVMLPYPKSRILLRVTPSIPRTLALQHLLTQRGCQRSLNPRVGSKLPYEGPRPLLHRPQSNLFNPSHAVLTIFSHALLTYTRGTTGAHHARPTDYRDVPGRAGSRAKLLRLREHHPHPENALLIDKSLPPPRPARNIPHARYRAYPRYAHAEGVDTT